MLREARAAAAAAATTMAIAEMYGCDSMTVNRNGAAVREAATATAFSQSVGEKMGRGGPRGEGWGGEGEEGEPEEGREGGREGGTER